MSADVRNIHRRWPRQLMLLALLLPVAAMMAPTADASAAGEGDLEVVADGLSNPRGVDVGPGDRIYVAEAGRGGDTRVDVTLGDGTNPVCVGETSAITEIRGQDDRVLASFPSLSAADEGGECPGSGDAAGGVQGVAVNGRGTLSVTVGLGADPAPEVREAIVDAVPEADVLGTAQRVLPNGRTTQLGDLVEFETSNPDQAGVDSNPYGIAIDDDGSRLVVDAGGNTLVRLGTDGDASLVAVFAPQCVPFDLPIDNPIPEAENPCGSSAEFPAQAVPTDIAIGPDGDYYVSELGGFPFAPETARVWRVDADRTEPASCSTFDPVPNDGCEVYANGLTGLVGVDFGPDGELYAVQIADDGVFALEEAGGTAAGSVQVIPPGGGAATASIGGLTSPGGIAVDGHDLYITNFSTSAEAGELVTTRAP